MLYKSQNPSYQINNFIVAMQQSNSFLSEKDLQFIKHAYRNVVEAYYDKKNDENAQRILIANNLIMQLISNRQQSNSILLISILEILKLKIKSHQSQLGKEASRSVEDTIIHLKNPHKLGLQNNTILQAMQDIEMSSICLLALLRFYEIEMKGRNYNWKDIILKTAKQQNQNLEMNVDVLLLLLKDHRNYAKDVARSGFVKYLFSIHLSSILNKKNNLYKVLKLLKVISQSDRTILFNREKYLSPIIFQHHIYIPIIEEITEECFELDYSQKVIDKAGSQQDIDQLYIWCINRKFCELANQDTINRLQKLKASKGETIEKELQMNIYFIISNLIKWNPCLKVSGTFLKAPPIHGEANLLFYLKMLKNSCKNYHENYQYVDFRTIEYIYTKFVGSDPQIGQTIASLKSMIEEPNKTKPLRSSVIQNFSHSGNAEEFMEAVASKPKNNSELDNFIKVLNKEQKFANEYEHDSMNLIKEKALKTLREAVVQRQEIKFWPVMEQYHPQNPQYLNSLFKILQLYLAIDLDRVAEINNKKLLQLIIWLQNNHGTKIIDWVAISQILQMTFEEDEWAKHLGEIPKHCFWLLNAKDGPHTGQIVSQLKKVDVSQPKLPLIFGFVGKTNDEQLKHKILHETGLAREIVRRINCFQKRQQISLDQYLISVVNASYYIYDWNKSKYSKKIENEVIIPIFRTIEKVFQSSQHEIRFIENSLPYQIGADLLLSISLNNILENHGKLSAQLLKDSNQRRNMDHYPIHNLSSEENPTKIQQIFQFLQQQPNLISYEEIQKLLMKLMSNKEEKYWELYPHYSSILTHVISVCSKSNQTHVIQRITDIIYKVLEGTYKNEQIANEQFEELYYELEIAIDRLNERKVYIDGKKIRRQGETIIHPQSKERIMEKLKKMEEKIKLLEKQEKEEMIQIVQNKSEKLPKENEKGPMWDEHEIEEEPIKNDKYDVSELLRKEDGLKEEELTVIRALKKLKKITEKEEEKNIFPELVQVFMKNQLLNNQRHILGHLLTIYYTRIEKNSNVIQLLHLKDKTNLNKDECYKFIKQHEEVIGITKRWKLIGNQFLQLGMVRIQTNSQYKSICIENGCELVQYNLTDVGEVEKFRDKRYHEIVCKLMGQIQQLNQAIPYLMLIGTSARCLEIKQYYIKNKIHISLLKLMNKQGWESNVKFISNLSYALSSIVYTQNHIAGQVVNQTSEFVSLLEAYKQMSNKKPVVEAGCSLISNLCYSNPQTKEALYRYGIIPILLLMIKSNIDEPQVSTFKVLMRSLGNLSLHKKSVEDLIDGNITGYSVELVEKLQIFIQRDEQKLKLLKLVIDLFSNISTLKYNTHKLHREGATNMIVTLLETTQISEDQILMGCIDTIDGLCQLDEVENFVVMDKNLPYLLIDLLKVKEDERLITKCIRLLTNLTINKICIPYILQANLLSVLANIVLPVYQNNKIEGYVGKILFRIYAAAPETKLLLKSGYLDCLIKTIEIVQVLENAYIDILLHYSKFIPNYLNNRTFFNLVRLLTSKSEEKEIVEKCLKIFKVIFTTEEQAEEDILIEGSPNMYEKLLMSSNAESILFVIGLHCTKSETFRASLILEHDKKNCNLISIVHKISERQNTREIGSCVLFAILNRQNMLINIQNSSFSDENAAYQLLLKGFKCKLFRIDGTSKNAVIDINEEYIIRAYKYPGGEIKKKYVIGLRQIRDWQFEFRNSPNSWKSSVFPQEKSLLNEPSKIENCLSILGSSQWGVFNIINVEMENQQEKNRFAGALSRLMLVFRG